MIRHHVVSYAFDSSLLSAACDAIIAFFSVRIWIVYRNQLTTMKRALAETRASNEIAERALVLGRRAWLVIQGTPIFKGSGGWVFSDVTIANVAEIPAIIGCFGSGRIEGEPQMLDLEKGQRSNATEIIVGGNIVHLNLPAVPPPTYDLANHAATWEDIGQAKIYCFVEYTDCFEKKWLTTACWKPDGEGGWRRVGEYTTLK